MAKIPHLTVKKDGDWSEWFWATKNFRQVCCDCHLAHDFQFRVEGDKLYLRIRENKRSTAACRRKIKK